MVAITNTEVMALHARGLTLKQIYEEVDAKTTEERRKVKLAVQRAKNLGRTPTRNEFGNILRGIARDTAETRVIAMQNAAMLEQIKGFIADLALDMLEQTAETKNLGPLRVTHERARSIARHGRPASAPQARRAVR